VTNLSLELNSDKLVTAPADGFPGVPPPPASMAAPGAMAPPPSLPTLPPGKISAHVYGCRVLMARKNQSNPGYNGKLFRKATAPTRANSKAGAGPPARKNK